MIKFDNDIIYLSGGEACYILSTGGGIKQLFCGSRIEPEDDVRALCHMEKEEIALPKCTRGGKRIMLAPTVSSVEVLKEKPTAIGTLSGGKTAKVTLTDDSGITVELFYTAYSRGGFTRRVEIYNGGEKVKLSGGGMNFAFEPSTPLWVDGNGEVMSGEPSQNRDMTNFAAATDGERAFGVLAPYADGTVQITGDGAFLPFPDIELGKGERARSAEMLIVVADSVDGLTRIFHDILREYMYGQNGRCHTVLFLPQGTDYNASPEKAAYELGCDIVAVDVEVGYESIMNLSAACKRTGIKAGLRVRDVFASGLAEIIRDFGITYMLVELNRGEPNTARSVYEKVHALRDRFPELKTEMGTIPDCLHDAWSLCYPPSTVRTAVKPLPAESFKTRFDNATVYALGYEFDPATLDDGQKRAVRAQILSYQDDAPIVMSGDVYRTKIEGGVCKMSVNKDKSRAYAVCTLGTTERLRLFGLDAHNLYRVREMNKTFSGAALSSLGIPIPQKTENESTFVLHLRQVADYEN